MGIDTFATTELTMIASFSVHSPYAPFPASPSPTSQSGSRMPLKNAAGLYIAFFSDW